MNDTLQTRLNTIRFLAADMVQQARSGHPGLPMGAAAMAYTIWTRHLRHNPSNPRWANRDRFILSGGHGSALLYALLYLTGYDLSLDELKRFRQWGSRTPGHPEYGLTPGVETTTGPLGQGFANGVGMAIAESHLAAIFNRPEHEIVNHYVYAIVTDGDLMEGVASEAASLAGHLQLGKLIYLYNDNHISIEGETGVAFTEDRAARFAAYGWQVIRVDDGNDVEALDAAIQDAKADSRPSLILCRTHIGYGMPHKQDTPKAHGEPPGDEELAAAKKALGWDADSRFYVPEETLAFFREARARGEKMESEWNARFDRYSAAYPDLAAEFRRRMEGTLPEGWEKALPSFAASQSPISTRAASGKTLNALADTLPELMGGSADLASSNKTWLNAYEAFSPETPSGRNLHFGVREHAMAAAINGMAYHGGILPYAAPFLVFSDYLRGALRVAALSRLRTVWVFTHDSIGVGEDGPTHQPVEHLAALRAIPNLTVLRPADANETAAAWQVAVENETGPTALILSRQNLPLVTDSLPPVSRGAYVLREFGGAPDVILMASGSEVSLTLDAAERLAAEGTAVRVVSFPSWELFDAQEDAYRAEVLPPDVTARVAVEAGVAQGWRKYVGSKGAILSIETFGASAPGNVVFEQYGFTVENVLRIARTLLAA